MRLCRAGAYNSRMLLRSFVHILRFVLSLLAIAAAAKLLCIMPHAHVHKEIESHVSSTAAAAATVLLLDADIDANTTKAFEILMNVYRRVLRALRLTMLPAQFRQSTLHILEYYKYCAQYGAILVYLLRPHHCHLPYIKTTSLLVVNQTWLLCIH